MRLVKITSAYPGYLKEFYDSRPDTALLPCGEQKKALDRDAFGWADFWSHALSPLGYEVLEITRNAGPLQEAWARENGVKEGTGPVGIVVEQVKRFRPDILWFDDTDEALLRGLRDAVPSLRLVLGWVGSAIPASGVWSDMDLILSCAPESVAVMKDAGHEAAHLHHGFDPRVPGRLADRGKTMDISFIGQVVRSGGVHRHREEFLEKVAQGTSLEIFSPSAGFTWRDDATSAVKSIVYRSAHALRAAGIPASWISAIPLAGGALRWQARPVSPVNRRLKRFLRPPVFGLDMFQVIRDSRITLNIHADSSPRFASNMRLFETTGVGTCLVTDWRENLHELFEPDSEVVTYRSADECMEKVRWLLDNPEKREDIAMAGMRRTLREHTFEHRAAELDRIIRTSLVKRSGQGGAAP